MKGICVRVDGLSETQGIGRKCPSMARGKDQCSYNYDPYTEHN